MLRNVGNLSTVPELLCSLRSLDGIDKDIEEKLAIGRPCRVLGMELNTEE